LGGGITGQIYGRKTVQCDDNRARDIEVGININNIISNEHVA
jgi:hypothetical protein